jgi:hypothetical protein
MTTPALWSQTQSPLRRTLLCATLLACGSDTTLGPAAPPESAAESAAAVDAMAGWNVVALRTTAAGPFSPPRETRAVAIVSAAVFDAVNSISARYSPYAVRVVAARDASTAAAVGAAAHDVLAALYPAAAASLDAAYDSALARVSAGRARDDGAALGRTVAAAVLAMRSRDHAADPARYVPNVAAGAWAPTPPALAAALEPGWGKVTPFLCDSGAQFRPAPPPALGGEVYMRDFAEIARVGAAASAARTAAQTETARFWMATAPQLWNQVVRRLTVARGLDAPTAARAYLLLNLAGADAMVAAWDAKYAYGQWRPVTAIRFAGDDGSPATLADSAWTPLLPTPPFPDYPAGHTSYAGAAEVVLSAALGESPGELSITSATAAGATHHYRSFHEIADEVVDARVWAGVHWRTSSTAGRELGRRIGELAVARAPGRIE